MGAIYLEKGLDEVRGIVHKLLEKVYPVIDLEALFKDYKTTLQELTQARFNQTPEYKVVDSFGPDHKKEFIISVEIDGKEYGKARGGSKKQAQQNVAKIALSTLNSQKL
jgi:ribonuclease-3